MPINKEIESSSLEQLTRWWSGEEMPDWAEAYGLVKESVASALRKRPEGVAFLKSRIKSEDLQEQGKALWFLSRQEICDEEIIGYLIDAFRNPGDLEPRMAFAFKAMALGGLMTVERYHLEQSEVEELLECGHDDAAARAMVYLSKAFPDDAMRLLRSGLQSPSPIMRAYACTEAGFRDFIELRGEVEGLQRDPHPFVARSALIGYDVFRVFEWKRQSI